MTTQFISFVNLLTDKTLYANLGTYKNFKIICDKQTVPSPKYRWHFFIRNPFFDHIFALVKILNNIHRPSHMVKGPCIYNPITYLLWLWQECLFIFLVCAIAIVGIFEFWLSNPADTLVWLRSYHNISTCSIEKLNPVALLESNSTM